MIGTIDIEVQAARPDLPLEPVRAYVGSPSSFRVRNVPRKIGSWEITEVYVNVNYPDNTSLSAACVLIGGVWVATVSACDTAGVSALGFSVVANGVDENGNAIEGYILGKGELEILDGDGTITTGTTTRYIHVCDSQPETPKQGDAYTDSGVWYCYNGSEWVVLGGVSAGNAYIQSPTSEGGDGLWHRMYIVDGTIAYDSEGIAEPPLAASTAWVTSQIEAEAAARDAADDDLSDAISGEATTRANADTALGGRIDDEEDARAAADQALEDRFDGYDDKFAGTAESGLKTLVENEVTARANADADLDDRIDAEATTRGNADDALGDRIDGVDAKLAGTSESGLKTLVENEVTARANADADLDDRIDAEATTRANADTQIASSVTAETAARVAADDILRGSIDDFNDDLADEAAARAAADGEMDAAISGEATTRANADADLDDRIDAEATTRANADTTLDTRLTAAEGTLSTHAANTSNPHSVTASQVGLGNVDNTSDADKPVSTAVAAELAQYSKLAATEDITGAKSLVDCGALRVVNTNVTVGTAPAATRYPYVIVLHDSARSILAWLQGIQETSNSVAARLGARNIVSGSDVSGYVDVIVDGSGNRKMSADGLDFLYGQVFAKAATPRVAATTTAAVSQGSGTVTVSHYGWVSIICTSAAAGGYVRLENGNLCSDALAVSSGNLLACYVPCSAGQTISWYCGAINSGATVQLSYIPNNVRV